MVGFDVRQRPVTRPRWAGLAGALRADLATVTDRVVERHRALPTCRALTAAELRPDLHACLAVLITGWLDDADPVTLPDQGPVLYARLGARRAAQGVSATDLLTGWRIVAEELLAHARLLVPADGESDGVLLQLAERLLLCRDGALVASVEGHRRVESERDRREHHNRATLVRRLLTGTAAPEHLRGLVDRLGIDPTGTWFAVRARPVTAADVTRLEDHLCGGSARHGVVALLDGDVCGVVHRLPAEPGRMTVGVDGPVPLDDLPAAFRRATRALQAALALGRGGALDVAALGVGAAVVADDDVGEAMLARYVHPLSSQGPAGELILDTLARYLAHDARLDATARELHVHVNTVRYRLGRFEQVTGSSLRRHDTLVEVWWALRRRSLNRAV